MELEEYLYKYFKFNRKSERNFCYTFFPIIYYEFDDLKEDHLIKILHELSDKFYEYLFNSHKINDFKEFIFDEDKCIISSDFRLGIFYDSYKNELCFFNDELLRALPYKVEDIGLKPIYKIQNEVSAFYVPLVANPTDAFKTFLNEFIYNSLIASRGDYNKEALYKISDEEKNVIIDMIIDLGSYNSSFFEFLIDYFNDDKLTNYLSLIYECPNVLENVKRNVYFKLYKRTKKFYDISKTKYYLRTNNSVFSNALKNFIDVDDDTFNMFAKEALKSTCNESRSYVFCTICQKYNVKLRPEYMGDINKFIYHKPKNYDEFVEELLDVRPINEDKCCKLLKKYVYTE